MNRIKDHIPAVFYALTVFVLIMALFTACTLQPGGGNGGGGGGSSSTGDGSSSVSSPVPLPQGNNIVYVATTGSDASVGTNKAAPLLTIQKAVSNAAALGFTKIYVGQGTYTQGAGLSTDSPGLTISNNNIRLYGGCDSGFNNQAGRSVLDSHTKPWPYQLIFINNVTNIQLDGFVFTGGTGDDGGMYLLYVTNAIITNFICSNNNNKNGSDGGGISIFLSSLIMISGIICNNSTVGVGGGGIYLYNSSYNTINAVICSNTAQYGGGIYLLSADSNTISGSVYNNTSSAYGGGLGIANSMYNSISSAVYCNNVPGGFGGGMDIYQSSHNLISGAVYNNSAQFGGGLFIEGGSAWNSIMGDIMSNYATVGGGIALQNATNNIIAGTVSFNTNYGIATNGIMTGNDFETVVNNTPGPYTNF